MWECAESFCDELLGGWYPRESRRVYWGLKSFEKADLACLDQGRLSVRKFVNTWSALAKDYTARDLTQSKDRVIAIAGVAEALQSEHGWQYHAGAWVESMPYHLLWWVDWKTEEGVSEATGCHPRSSTVAEWDRSIPSWSWFKKPKDAAHSLEFWYQYQFTWEHEQKLFTTRLMHFQWPERPTSYVPNTAFHEFTGLQIALAVARITTSLEKTSSGRTFRRPGNRCLSLEEQIRQLKYGSKFWCLDIWYVCDAIEDVKSPPESVSLALLTETYTHYGRGKESYNRHLLEGLGLRPGSKEGTWHRHGYWAGVVSYEMKDPFEKHRTPEVDEQKEATSTEDTKTDPQAQAGVGHSLFLSLPGVRMETLELA
jgi:hypothetical protein